MKVLAIATSFVEAPSTATVFGSNSGRNVSDASVSADPRLRLPRAGFGQDEAGVGRQNARLGVTITGLRSTSAMSAPRLHEQAIGAADLQDRLDQRLDCRRPPRRGPLPAAPRPLSSPSMARASALGDRADAERDVLEDLDEDAAETDHDHRPELRIAIAADDHLAAGRDHLLDEPAVDPGSGNSGLCRHRVDGLGDGPRRPDIQRDAADVGLVQDLTRDDLDHEGRLHLGRPALGLDGVAGERRARRAHAEAREKRLACRLVERPAALRPGPCDDVGGCRLLDRHRGVPQ